MTASSRRTRVLQLLGQTRWSDGRELPTSWTAKALAKWMPSTPAAITKALRQLERERVVSSRLHRSGERLFKLRDPLESSGQFTIHLN